MTEYRTHDTGESGSWATMTDRPLYHVEPYIAMQDPEPQPEVVWYRSRRLAIRAAITHTLSEPWRAHAFVTRFGRAGITERLWYYRDSCESGYPIKRERILKGSEQ